MRNVRWSGEGDRYWGPFTYARDGKYHVRQLGAILSSGKLGDEDDGDESRCSLRLHLLGHTLIVALPQIIKPDREWHEIKTEPTRSQMIAAGRKPGYWDMHSRDFGFCWVEGAVHYDYGAKTMDSQTDKGGIWTVPWLQKRHIRTSLYDLQGYLFADIPESRGRRRKVRHWTDEEHAISRNGWDVRRALEEACPTRQFLFADFDGEQIIATTRIGEGEWLQGERWFKWLSWFTKPYVRRSLDLSFSAEVGKRKGSWKGGAMGHAIYMLPGELHEAAFRRYCDENKLTFLREIVPEPAPSTSGSEKLAAPSSDQRGGIN